MMHKPIKILIAADYYLPGYKSGGPIRTLSNIIDNLGDEYHFKVITRDRDLGDDRPYPGITSNSWHKVGNAEVFYVSPKYSSLRNILSLITGIEYDLLYLNSYFSYEYTIRLLVLRRLKLIPQLPLVLAPRGEFSSGALAIKNFKKLSFISLSKVASLYKNVFWQASSQYEEADIKRWFGDRVKVVIASDLPPNFKAVERSSIREKILGELKIIFVSRISRMKNLSNALKMLPGLNGKVQFNIFGPIEDLKYWKECQSVIKQIPNNIEVRYMGEVPNSQVITLMAQNDLFLFPTLGENFGHVILEALIAGTPVVISDQTPWRGLEEKGIGWDIPLEQPEQFKTVLQQCIDMDDLTYKQWSERAYDYGLKFCNDESIIQQNRDLFRKALSL